jgi:hypothetical protein
MRDEDIERRLQAVEAHPRLNDRLWFSWTRWTWMVIAYVALWASAVAALYALHH